MFDIKKSTSFYARVSLWVIGILFFLASLSKLVNPMDFAVNIYRYQLVPYAWINFLALLIPWMEFVAALAVLFVPRYREGGLWIIFSLLIIFSLGLIISLVRGLDISCGCFSSNPEAAAIGGKELFRNFLLMVLSGGLLYSRRKPVRR